MLRAVGRATAVIAGGLLVAYPAYSLVREWLITTTRFPQNARTAWRLIESGAILYGFVLAAIVLYARHVRRVVPRLRLGGREVFTGGLMGSVVVLLLGFFGPFVFAWATRTEAGNLSPLLGIFGFLVGLVISFGAGVLAYGVLGRPSNPSCPTTGPNRRPGSRPPRERPSG